MNRSALYVLDSDVFMTAARTYYAFDVAPAFWKSLEREAANNRVRSIDRVKHEIDRGKDDLKQWANGSFHAWFESTDDLDVVDAYRQIMEWVSREPFSPAAKDEFANAADGWLIAYAKAKACVVVTNEKPQNTKRKIKIPNVCQAFGVPYTDTFGMMRALGVIL